jgi:hypothetical protein
VDRYVELERGGQGCERPVVRASRT